MKHQIIVYEQPLSGVVQKHSKVMFNYPAEKIWNQKGVSIDRRLAKDAKLQSRIVAALSPANLDKYVVPADETAPARCIDGRILVGWQDSKQLQAQPLGPKIAGGTVHAALAHRVVDAEHMTQNLILEEDLKYVIAHFKAVGLGFGGHIDNNQSGSNTGCGAVDNINLILDRLQRPEHQEQLRGLAKMILGDAYDSKIVNEVIGRLLYLDALKPRYMPKENDDPNGEFLYKRSVVATIRDAADKTNDAVPALTGSHYEIALVLNLVPATTIDTDRFSYDNNNQIQVFGWDVWQMYAEAKRLYRYNMYEEAKLQREAVEKRLRYLTTRTLLGVSTLMVLTDGSLRLATVAN